MQQFKIQNEIKVKLDEVTLTGDLHLPEDARALVLFSHGSGSSRLSPRNQYVASILQKKNIGTLLFDLLTKEEDQIYENRFNIQLLIERLASVTEWLMNQTYAKDLSLGYFGASTGAASAIGAAALRGDAIKAIVSRGGRPDLALPLLPRVQAATLFIVGSLDGEVINLNRKAYDRLTTKKELAIISGAGHLFEEPGKLDVVAEKAAEWFKKYLVTETL